MNEQVERLKIVQTFASAFPQSKMDKQAIVTWTSLVDDIPTGELAVALKSACSKAEWFPAPGAVRKEWLSLTSHNSELALPTWEEAWGEVAKQIMRTGQYGTPQFSHPLIATIVERMNWLELCRSEKQAVDRAQFRDMYKQSVERGAQIDGMIPAARQLAAQSGVEFRLPDLSMDRKRIEEKE